MSLFKKINRVTPSAIFSIIIKHNKIFFYENEDLVQFSALLKLELKE